MAARSEVKACLALAAATALVLVTLAGTGVSGGCLITDDLVPEGTETVCPRILNEMDITDNCVLEDHKTSSGSGHIRCSFTPTLYETCPGIHCRLGWGVKRHADGRFQVVLEPSHIINCSTYEYFKVHASVERCEDLFNKTPCTDVVDWERDGRVHFDQFLYQRCTCIGANCSARFSSTVEVEVNIVDQSSPFAIPAAISIGAVLGIFSGILAVILVCRYKQRRAMYKKTLQAPESVEMMVYGEPRNIKLIRYLARGRFGMAHLGQDDAGEQVVVKVTNEKNKAGWSSECSLLSNSYMRHSTIIRFQFGEERLAAGSCKELWLVTDYYQRGSLYKYLKDNPLSWNECADLMLSLSDGVDYLHDDSGLKPQIAHRDLKSTNILIKDTPQPRCILADFNLAIAFVPEMDKAQRQHQVGTPRYMAPECLASCMNFDEDISFLEADIYSLGLLLWEISAGCCDFAVDGSQDKSRHELPYWTYVGDQPTIRAMEEFVIRQEKRPSLPRGWEMAMRSVKELGVLANVLNDCWEKDCGARLTAAAVKTRMVQLDRSKVETEMAIKQAMSAGIAASSPPTTPATKVVAPIPGEKAGSPVPGEKAISPIPGANTVGLMPQEKYPQELQPPEYTEELHAKPPAILVARKESSASYGSMSLDTADVVTMPTIGIHTGRPEPDSSTSDYAYSTAGRLVGRSSNINGSSEGYNSADGYQ